MTNEAEDEGEWITVNGAHVFIPKGYDKDTITKAFIAQKTQKDNIKQKRMADKDVAAKRLVDYKAQQLQQQNDPEFMASLKSRQDAAHAKIQADNAAQKAQNDAIKARLAKINTPAKSQSGDQYSKMTPLDWELDDDEDEAKAQGYKKLNDYKFLDHDY